MAHVSAHEWAHELAQQIRIGRRVLPWCGVALLLTSTLFAPALRAGPAGLVKRVSGTVVVERTGQALPVALGFAVQPGDVVTTASASSVGLVFKDNSCVGVGPKSRYTIDRFAFDEKTHAGAFSSSLARGSLSMISGKLAKQSPDAVTVQTPSTILGVRGTQFLVEVP